MSVPEEGSATRVKSAPLTTEQARELIEAGVRSALIADALDALGSRHQCLGPDLVPVQPGSVLLGNAFTVRAARVSELPEVPYVGLLAALDVIAAGDVFTVSTDGAADVAVWGELLTRACLARGAVGSVCDGLARDVRGIGELNFPAFCRGTVPYDSNGRVEVLDFGGPIVIDGVSIRPGDLIVGDEDGVVIVPVELGREVLARAVEKGAAEASFREALGQGALPSEAFARHNVL